MVWGSRIKELIAALIIASLVIHSFIYEYRVTLRTNAGMTQCDIIYSPTPSGNYLMSGACLTPEGKYVKVIENISLYNILKEAIKVGSKEKNTSLRFSGQVVEVKYELLGKYGVTLLSELGVGVVSVIASLVIAGAAYTLINWRKYIIH